MEKKKREDTNVLDWNKVQTWKFLSFMVVALSIIGLFIMNWIAAIVSIQIAGFAFFMGYCTMAGQMMNGDYELPEDD